MAFQNLFLCLVAQCKTMPDHLVFRNCFKALRHIEKELQQKINNFPEDIPLWSGCKRCSKLTEGLRGLLLS